MTDLPTQPEPRTPEQTTLETNVDDGAEIDALRPAPEPDGAEDKIQAEVREFHTTMAAVRGQLGRVIVGQDEVLEQLLVTVLVGGHCLITGLPGTAKTLTVKTLARALGLDFKRIQFTPDLMPTDVTGTDIIDVDPATGERSWRFVGGPVFTNVLLADEINRTPPKTQSALLEAMQELSVTIRGSTHQLSPPFVVLATQNPIELEGTYPLPEAQLDRFLFNVELDYLSAEEELAVIERNTLGMELPEVDACTDGDQVRRFQELVRQVPIADEINRYAVEIVRATRPEGERPIDSVKSYVAYGASVRAAIFLSLAARARALLAGRFHVTGEDVEALAHPVLRHRMQLNYLAESDEVSVDDVISQVLGQVQLG